MNLKITGLKQSLNPAYRLVKPRRTEIELFKTNLITLLGQIDEKESEENVKFHLMQFLRDTFYHPHHLLATKGRTDFVIHTGKDATTAAGVLFEVKRPANTAEMVNKTSLNTRALHELVLYYLRERVEHQNNDIRHLVITNIYEWFIFDATVFERLFYKNTQLLKQYREWAAKQKVSSGTDLFYNEIAKPFVAALQEEIPFTWFDIRAYESPLKNASRADDHQLITLFKVFTPTHLLKLPFANDSNSLDKGFYAELLHLVGLEEVKEGSKKIIRRKPAGSRNDGSLLENTIAILDTEHCLHKVPDLNSYGETNEEQLFSVALELCITWVNRILFLKLLEAQLIKYHKGDTQYRFLNYETLPQYDELYKLFFQVLAKRPEERIEKVKRKYGHIPYLNSSLFDFSDLETATIKINMLDDAAEMELLPSTILRNEKNKPRAAQLNTLQYLFEFLDAYDFAGEGSEEIQEESKTLINASVLGLIFEKINGYKDGSIFTPGFITMYMCRQAIRQSILNKFTETYHWKADAFEDLYNYISEDRSAKKLKEYNALVNSITLCDPAVGSGHFLVSALNELIYIKAGLGILTDEQGKRLAEADIKLENDELLVFDKQGDPFTYTLQHGEGGKPYITPWKQTLQKTLFHEKQTLIEHCLFGVDVNPKSVQICRLRLWIELLKHAYYTETGELQTLPNIDINIKCGNSLISRFALNEDLTTVFRQSKYSVETYKTVVQAYKESRNREEKEQLQQFVKELKEQFRTMVYQRDPLRKKIADLRGQLLLLENNIDLFGNRKKTDKELAAEKKKLTQALTERETELAEKENSKIYNNAFEWRFEFPEVLNDKGEYIGFDVVIGNPPYIRQEEVKHLSSYFENNYKTFSGKADVYVYFYEKGVNILKENGVITYITSGKFFEANYGKNLTTFLLDTLEIREIVDFKDLPVFDGVTAYPLIFNAKKQIKDDYDFSYIVMSELPKEKLENLIHDTHPLLTSRVIFKNNNYKFVNSRTAQLLEKINQNSVSIEDFCGLPVVGIKTGYNEGFLTSIKDDKFVKPYVFGRDIKKYKTVNPPESIIFPYDGDFNIVQFNSHSDIYSQLLRFKDNLSKRAIISEGLKSGIKEWYEYQQINKTLDYNSEYIVYPNVSLGNNFTFSKGNAIDMTGFVIKSNNRYLLAILNSKLVEFLMGIWSIGRRGGYLEYKVQYISKIPVKKISESEQVPFVKLVEEIYSSKSNQVLSIERKIDQLVYQLYGLTEAEIAIVEGRG